RDGRLAVAHLLENATSCVQAYVPTAYYEDPGTLRGAHGIEYPPAPRGSLVRPFTSLCEVSATLRRSRDGGHGATPEPRCRADRCQGRASCRSRPSTGLCGGPSPGLRAPPGTAAKPLRKGPLVPRMAPWTQNAAQQG